MTQFDSEHASSSDRFDYIETLLQSYPDIREDQLEDLKGWFKKEASAFDVANLAGKESCKEGYRKFRVDHIDRFDSKDMLILGLVAFAIICLISYAVYSAM